MRKTVTYLAALLIFMVATASAQWSSPVSGKVTTKDGTPVANTTLWFTAVDTSLNIPVKATETDSMGNYSQNWFPVETTISQHDTFSYKPTYTNITPELAKPLVQDIVFEHRTQDATFSGSVAHNGTPYSGDIFLLKLPADIDPEDFMAVESHYVTPYVPTRWASYKSTIDGKGSFAIDVLFGNYVIYVPGNEELLSSWSVLTINMDITGHQIEMVKMVHISGQVHGTSGYDYVTISGYSVNSGRPFMAEANLADEGKYDIKVAPGEYKLRLQAYFNYEEEGHVYAVYYDSTFSRDEAAIVDATNDVSAIDFSLPQPEVYDFTVSGTVTSAGSQKGLANAHVTVASANAEANLLRTFDAVTDENGAYTIKGKTMLMEDSLVAFAQAEGFFAEFYENETTFLTADFIKYKVNSTTTVNFELDSVDASSGYSISGTVTDTLGNPIGFGQVTAYTTDTNTGVTYVQVDENGNYSFPEIFPTGSTVMLQCWVGFDYKPELYKDAASWEDATPIVIGNENVSGADFTLEPVAARRATIGSVKGKVKAPSLGKTSSANSFAGYMVYIRQNGQEEWLEADFVDSEGNFKLGVEGYGNYELLLSAPDKQDEIHQIVVDEQSGLTIKVELTPNSIIDKPVGTARSFKLHSAYPNPFNPLTNIQVDVDKAQFISLEIYNVLGQKVKTLYKGMLQQSQRFVWNGKDNAGNTVASGLYFYQLRTKQSIQTKSLTFLK